jgi:hypothetical protein
VKVKVKVKVNDKVKVKVKVSIHQNTPIVASGVRGFDERAKVPSKGSTFVWWLFVGIVLHLLD